MTQRANSGKFLTTEGRRYRSFRRAVISSGIATVGNSFLQHTMSIQKSLNWLRSRRLSSPMLAMQLRTRARDVGSYFSTPKDFSSTDSTYWLIATSSGSIKKLQVPFNTDVLHLHLLSPTYTAQSLCEFRNRGFTQSLVFEMAKFFRPGLSAFPCQMDCTCAAAATRRGEDAATR